MSMLPRHTGFVVLTAWACLFLPTLGISEPYQVVPGDTLAKIAKHHKTTVKVLMDANHLRSSDLIRAKQILIIPELPTMSGSAPLAPRAAEPDQPARDLITLRRGLKNGWIVTRDKSTGRLFVHAKQLPNGDLEDLKYIIKETKSELGSTWAVHRPAYNKDGTAAYGEAVGVMSRPSDVKVGICVCD